jgi:hypothetical protein
MRILAGCLLLLAIGSPTISQNARKPDYLHGKAHSTGEFEVRPGIDMGVVWGEDKAVCRADITALPPQESMSSETVDGVLDEIAPPKKRGTLRAQGSFQFWQVSRYDNVSITRTQVTKAEDLLPRITLASVEFHRAACARDITYHIYHIYPNKPTAVEPAK